MTRYVAILTSAEPLNGACPACGGLMDDTGCRIGDHFLSRDPAVTRGIAQIIDVFCDRRPTVAVVDCPACPA